VSARRSASVTITLSDTTAPSVTAFSVPATATTLTVAISTFTASDNVGVTGYLVNQAATTPSATATGWSSTAQSSYTFTTAGTKTLYGWAKDAVGNVSASRSASVTITLSDTIPPVVSISAPTSGATFSGTITVSASASDNVGIAGVQFLLDGVALGSEDIASPYSIFWSTTQSSNGTHTLSARARDGAGNQTTSAGVSVTVNNSVPPAGTYTLWSNSVVPAIITADDPSAVELGVKFRSDVAGYVTGIRFYKGPRNTGTHVGSLWSSTGQRLATVTFTNETASGWQQASLSTPVAITANTTYVASYHTNVGYYSGNEAYFAASGSDNPPLHALANGVAGGNGVYRYGATSAFPNQTWNSSNYWVDVVFVPQM
jgi:hypothetical protein